MKALKIKLTHINEATARFNGCWENDFIICDQVAGKYGYLRNEFSQAVYKHVNK